MKKLLLIGIILILVGCSNENVSIVTADQVLDETVVTEVSEDDLWYVGFAGQDTIHLRLTFLDNQVVGEYYLNDQEAQVLRGYLEGDMIYVKGDHEFYLTQEQNSYIGAMVSEDTIGVYATKNRNYQPSLDESTQIMQGHYNGVNGDYYTYSSLDLVALFTDYIYVDFLGVNGSVSDRKGLLLKSHDSDFKDLSNAYEFSLKKDEYHNIQIEFSDFDLNDGIKIDTTYSESHLYDPPQLDYPDADRIEKLLGDDLPLLLSLLQEKEGDYYHLYGQAKTAMIHHEGNSVYIAIRGQYFEDNRYRLYTNSIDYIPLEVQTYIGRDYVLNKLSITSKGQILPERGQEEAYLLEGYSIKDKVKGKLNKDSFEDLVLILDGQPRLMLILLGTSDGYRLKAYSETALLEKNEGGLWGDPYDDCFIEEYQLNLSFYGGSNYRWALTYTFDALMDFQLIKVETMTYFTGDGSFESVEYFLDSQKVIRTKGDKSDEIKSPHTKRIREYILFRNFDVRENINYDYY